MTSAAEAFVGGLTTYAALGLGFAVAFVAFGIARVDHQARGSGIPFRLIVFPGVAAFWPLLLTRWVRGIAEPPLETNEHRRRAAGGGAP